MGPLNNMKPDLENETIETPYEIQQKNNGP